MPTFWTQMYFEMSKLLTSWVGGTMIWFHSEGLNGSCTVLFLLRSETERHHFFRGSYFDLLQLLPFF